MRKSRTPIPGHVRIMRRVEMITESGCWIFMGSLLGAGYGHLVVGLRGDGSRRSVLAHRVMYEHHRGPIPTGLTLDHVKERCASKACCNPWHLEPVPQRVNVLRGESPAALCARRAACATCGGAYAWKVEGGRRRRYCPPCLRASKSAGDHARRERTAA